MTVAEKATEINIRKGMGSALIYINDKTKYCGRTSVEISTCRYWEEVKQELIKINKQ